MSSEAGVDASPFNFTRSGVNDELMAMRAGAEGDFLAHQAAQLALMGGFNDALLMSRQLLVAEADDGDVLTERRTTMGVLLAYNVLQASANAALVKVEPVFAVGYTNSSIGRPEMVKKHVAEDFPPDQHPWLNDMFTRLMNQPAIDAARVMIAMHGHQANPSREPRDISLKPERTAKIEAAKSRGGVDGTGLTAAQMQGGPSFPGALSAVSGGSRHHVMMEKRPSRRR